jgi:hypothetical protein
MLYFTRIAHWLTGQLYQMPHPVAHLRAAERQVLEVAGKLLKSSPSPKQADLHVQRAVEELLLDPHLGQTPGLATAPDFLHRAELPARGSLMRSLDMLRPLRFRSPV